MSEYISREASIKTLNDEGIEYNGDINYFIMNAPAADVQEVKHGEWKQVYEDCWECSICGQEYYLGIETPKENEYHYCPYCGAKMNGKEDKE